MKMMWSKYFSKQLFELWIDSKNSLKHDIDENCEVPLIQLDPSNDLEPESTHSRCSLIHEFHFCAIHEWQSQILALIHQKHNTKVGVE